jgi:hypothetical protein
MFWYWPGAFGYHLIYLRELMRSNFGVSISGPKIISKSRLRRDYPDFKQLHGNYGSIMSET